MKPLKMMKPLVVSALLGMVSAPALAEIRSAKLAVPGMTCAVCPVTVKKALEQVDGVQQVRVDFAEKMAEVRYDNSKTQIDQLIQATTKAGYPSSEIQGAKHSDKD